MCIYNIYIDLEAKGDFFLFSQLWHRVQCMGKAENIY